MERMKYFSYLRNFCRNIISLFISLFKVNGIFWGGSKNTILESKINPNTRIGGNHSIYSVSIGFGTAIGPNCKISQTTIGKFCSIGPNFLCGWGIHPINGISINPAFYSTARQNGFTYSKTDKINERELISIGNDVFIGANVTVLDGFTIGDGAVIGAGAVVSKDIPPYAIAVGCPIKIIKYRFTPEVIEKFLEIKWWDKDERVLKMVEKNFFNVDEFFEEIKKPL